MSLNGILTWGVLHPSMEELRARCGHSGRARNVESSDGPRGAERTPMQMAQQKEHLNSDERVAYAKEKLKPTSLTLYPMATDGRSWLELHAGTGKDGGVKAQFRTKDHFDEWCVHQRLNRMAEPELVNWTQKLAHELMLSGSGWDATPTWEYATGWNEAEIGVGIRFPYHLMYEGSYTGWVDVNVVWKWDAGPLDFEIELDSLDSARVKELYGDLSMFDDEIHWAISDRLPEWHGKIIWPGE